jgi:hypothetical protein
MCDGTVDLLDIHNKHQRDRPTCTLYEYLGAPSDTATETVAPNLSAEGAARVVGEWWLKGVVEG